MHTDSKGSHHTKKTDNGFLPAGKIEFLLDKSEYYGKYHKHYWNGACTAVCICGVGKYRNAVLYGICIKCSCNHIGKCRYYNQGKQPAEQKEKLTPCFAYVFFNKHAHGFTVIFNRGVKSAEVRDRSEKYAAEQHPKEYRKPAESRRLYSAGYGACTCYRRKLMAENGPAVCRYIVLAVIVFYGRSLRLGIYSPFFRKPASVKQIRRHKDNRRDKHNYKCVHFSNPSLKKDSQPNAFLQNKKPSSSHSIPAFG